MESNASELAVSVIVPLTDNRGQGLASIRRLIQEQSYCREKYEVVVIANGSAPELEAQVPALLNPQDLFLYHPSHNEFLLYDIGARHARGKLLFLTEAHCVLATDCLEKVVHYFATHPAAGGRCCSVGANAAENFLTQMEERVFDEQFQLALQPDHWLKVLNHGFGIYRDIYLTEGRIEPEFGQFAEWALAIRLHSRGYRLDYIPEARVNHYYLGNLKELFLFVRDFTHGECRYRAQYPTEHCERYFGSALEWTERESYRSVVARSLCRAALKSFSATLRQSDPVSMFSTQVKPLFRWGLTALFGPRWSLFKAKLAFFLARMQVWLWRFSPDRCFRAYQEYWTRAIRYSRFEFLVEHLSTPAPPWPEMYQYDIAQEEELLVGFHGRETWRGQTFRWSEPIALVQVSLPPRTYEAQLQLIKVRKDTPPRFLTFFFDGHKIPAFVTDSIRGTISFQLKPTMFAPHQTVHHLVWLCHPLLPWQLGSPDRRELGLPISSIHFSPR